MADGPDPSDDEATSEPLADTVDKSLGLETLLGDASGDHSSEATPEDVDNEESKGGAGFELHNGLLALGAGIVSLGFSVRHSTCIFVIKIITVPAKI